MTIVSRGDLIGLASVYGYVIAVLAVSWILRKRVSNPRKIVHIGAGGIIFFWWTFDSSLIMAGLAALPFIPLLYLATPKSPVRFLKESPLGERSSEGHTYGLVLYAVSWTVIAFFLFEDLFAASIAVATMSFGDGMGELIGRKFGKIHYLPNRTMEGSAAVFSATLLSIVVLNWFYFSLIGYAGGTPPHTLWLFGVAIAGLVTVLEALTPGSVDNLVVPLMIAALLHAMGV